MLRAYRICFPPFAATVARNAPCRGSDRAAAACAPSLSQRRWASDAIPGSPSATPASPEAGAIPSAAALGAAGTLADSVFKHDVLLSQHDLIPPDSVLSERFVDETFTVYATPERRKLARRVLAKSMQLLTGPQGFGKSFFAAGLVHELRRVEPHVPVMYLPSANFTVTTAAKALRFALEKAGHPPLLAPGVPVTDLDTVVAAMKTVTHKWSLRLVIDQMNTAFRVTPPNHKYAELSSCASWCLLVTSRTTSTLKLAEDLPTIDYGTLPLNETIGCAMLNRVLPEHLRGSAPLLYERTGGNPLELSTLVAHLDNVEYASKPQLEATVKSWFVGRVNTVHDKLTDSGPIHTRGIIGGWLNRDDNADPRFFAGGVALFPAVEAAMMKVLLTHPEFVPVGIKNKPDEARQKVYKNRARSYLARTDLFGQVRSKPTINEFVCNTVPADFAKTIATTPETSQLIIWWPNEDRRFNQRYFDFVYTLYAIDGNGVGTWYVAFVQCCGFVHRDTLTAFLGSDLWGEWRTALNGLRTVEYMWLSHTQPELSMWRPKILTPGAGTIPQRTIFPPPEKSKFVSVHPETSNSVLASSDPALQPDSWVYAAEDAGASPIPTVSLKLLHTSILEKPPTLDAVYVRVYDLPGVRTPAVVNVASTLNQGGLHHDVDGLKKAVMQKLANELQGIGITHLVVYPAGPARGTEPYTAMSTKLAPASESAPYHVVCRRPV